MQFVCKFLLLLVYFATQSVYAEQKIQSTIDFAVHKNECITRLTDMVFEKLKSDSVDYFSGQVGPIDPELGLSTTDPSMDMIEYQARLMLSTGYIVRDYIYQIDISGTVIGSMKATEEVQRWTNADEFAYTSINDAISDAKKDGSLLPSTEELNECADYIVTSLYELKDPSDSESASDSESDYEPELEYIKL